jgi:protocatechuate 3,4-dioxygenase beta subunit
MCGAAGGVGGVTGPRRGPVVIRSLTGTVTDETGATLPGASVTITQKETNVTHDVVTDETGSYRVPNLLPGTYEVVVKLQDSRHPPRRTLPSGPTWPPA